MGLLILFFGAWLVAGVVLTALYTRAWARAGYDDWGNYLAFLPAVTVLLLPFAAMPPVALAVLVLMPVAILGTPALLAWRRRTGRQA